MPGSGRKTVMDLRFPRMPFTVRLLIFVSLLLAYAAGVRYLAQRDAALVAYLHSDRIAPVAEPTDRVRRGAAESQLAGLRQRLPDESFHTRAEDLQSLAGLRQRLPGESLYAKTLGDRLLRSTPPQPDAAAAEYKKALLRAPCSLVHWRDWSRVNQRQGRMDSARKALETAEFLAPNDHLVQVEFGNLLLAENRPDDAARHHRRAIELTPSVAPAVYPAYWEMGWTPVQVAETLLTDDPKLLSRYWLQCLRRLDPKGTGELWESINRAHADALDAESHRRYFDFLIANKEYSQARSLWSAVAARFYKQRPGDDPAKRGEFWNGHFEFPIVFEGGLEWRIPKSLPPGARAVITSAEGSKPNKSLWIHFDGKENTAFSHVRHSFFVEPGKSYRLRYHVRSLGLTTENGPYVKISVYSDPPLAVKGQVVRGTGEWTFEQDFAVPAPAQWAEMSICRDRSLKLDNRIRGDVWFGEFILERVQDSPGRQEVSP